jgi:hypothetical protein
MKQRLTSNTQEIDKSGIYILTCNTCQMVNVGQTSPGLKQRYQEHIRYIKYNNTQSTHAQHILNNRHEYSPIDETMSLLNQVNNTALSLPHEQLYIQVYFCSSDIIVLRAVKRHLVY